MTKLVLRVFPREGFKRNQNRRRLIFAHFQNPFLLAVPSGQRTPESGNQKLPTCTETIMKLPNSASDGWTFNTCITNNCVLFRILSVRYSILQHSGKILFSTIIATNWKSPLMSFVSSRVQASLWRSYCRTKSGVQGLIDVTQNAIEILGI